MVECFSTLGGMSALSVVITDALVRSFNVTKGWVKQLISWLVPVLASCFGLLCQFGLFAAFGPITAWYAWVYTILTGFGVGLISNGLFDIDWVKTLLDKLIGWIDELRKKKAQPVVEKGE